MLRSMVHWKKPYREEDRSTGMEVVTGNEDLLTQILLRLPVRSLLRFKSVSKQWLSLISNPQFCILKSKHRCKHTSGILLNTRRYERGALKFEFVPLDHDCPAPFQRLDFLKDDDFRGFERPQFCNGLLLFQTVQYPSRETKCYVVNMTTKQQTIVSLPVTAKKLYFVGLAFDPRKSPYFKLIYLFCGGDDFDGDELAAYCVQIYSSETGLMTQVSDIFHTSSDSLSFRGIYWNGVINWIDYYSDGLYFNVDEERFGILHMPPEPQDEDDREICYYGESNDHLYLVQTDDCFTSQFDVYEMDKEYKGWFGRFHVDLRPFPTGFNSLSNAFSILAIVDKDDGENSFIVFGRPGKAIHAVRFHLNDREFTTICGGIDKGLLWVYNWTESIQFIESLHPFIISKKPSESIFTQNRGIYWNGAINWIDSSQTNTTPAPATQLAVYKMDREYSGWFVRFHVDLLHMFRAFPDKSNNFSILSVVDKDDGENSLIVFSRPEKAIRFHLTKLCDFPCDTIRLE